MIGDRTAAALAGPVGVDRLTAAWSVTRSDAVEQLQALAPGSVDLCITDMAYESLERHRARGTTTRLAMSKASSNAWFPIFRNARIRPLLSAMYAALAPARHAYLLCDEETATHIRIAAEDAGFYWWKSLVWVKTRQTLDTGPTLATTPAQIAGSQVRAGTGYHWQASTERIVFLEKRTRACTPPGNRDWLPVQVAPAGEGRQLNFHHPDVLFAPRVSGGYPTEKPVDLLRTLIENSTLAGELVVDPFCGSGSTGEAAISCGRRAMLSDISDAAVMLATNRLDALTGEVTSG